MTTTAASATIRTDEWSSESLASQSDMSQWRGACGRGRRVRGAQGNVGGLVEAPPGIPQQATSNLSCPSSHTETPLPLGFDFNHGSNYVPCLVTLNGGRRVPARYIHVVMSNDPYVISIIPGDNNHYGSVLHAKPSYDIDQFQRPCYGMDNLWHLKYGVDEAEEFNNALAFLHDHLLTAEVHCYRKAGMLEAS